MPAATPSLPTFPMTRECPFDPPSAYRSLRRTRPVIRVQLPSGMQAWLVTGHDLIRTLLNDTRLSADRTNPDFPTPVILPAEMKHELDRVSRALLGLDPPEHSARRRALAGEFTFRKAQALRPAAGQIVNEAVTSMLAEPGRRADLVDKVSLPVPSLVICELLGVPYADRAQFQGYARTLLDRSSTLEERGAAAVGTRDYFTELIAAKAAAPADDLLSRLLAANDASGVFDADSLIGIAMLLQLAGHETTANLISLSVVGLLENPDQLQSLRDDPSLLPGAVDEMLRYFTILDALYRVAVDGLEIGGVAIQPGDGVILCLGAANRDETVFPDPDQLQVTRPARQHMTFAYGMHQCLGQNLARMELELVLGALLARVPTLALAQPAAELPYKVHSDAYGIFEVPVTW